MSRKISTDMILPEPSEELITSEAWSMDAYADGLMDDLFSDLDRALEKGGNLSSRTVQREYSEKVNIKVPQIVVPENLQIVKPPQVLNNQIKTVLVDRSEVKASKQKIRKKSRFAWGKFLTRAASFGAVVGGMIWLVNSGLLNRLASSSFQQALREPRIQKQLPPNRKVDAQTELVNYMLGALTAIGNEKVESKGLSARNLSAAKIPQGLISQASQTSQNIASNTSSTKSFANLPPVTNASNALPPVPSRYTRVIERVKRVYVPVYKAPAPMRYNPPSIASAPKKLTPPKKSQPSAANSVKVASKAVRNAAFAAIRTGLKPVNIGKNPIAVKQPSKPISALLPAIPSAPTPPKLPTAKKPPVEEQKQEIATAKTITKHELKAVMDWGDKSAAIFKVEGADLQIRKGEAIGSSGWTLVEITGKEAIIRRNGEVRSIQAGQNL
ncbi:MAG: hypothetical protein AAF378_10235 [Cyanobacteria bacterium P01_A01_bin.84]